MPRWSEEEERILRRDMHLGAEVCASHLFRATGIVRSKEAVERHARRIGVSTARYRVCPTCGRKFRRLNRKTKRCVECSNAELVARARAERDRLMRELDQAGADERGEREYARLRKQNQRLRESVERRRNGRR